MKSACFLLFTLFVLSSVAQPFQADTFGRVKDPAFLKLINERNYQLVEDFTIVHDKLQLKLAKVWQYGAEIYIDLKGEEFKEKKEAIIYYKTGEKPGISEKYDRRKENEIIVTVEEYGESKDPLEIRFDHVNKLTYELLQVQKSRLYGVYTPTGTEVLPVIFSQIKYVDDAKCFVCQRPEDKRYYIYDNSGKLTTDCGFYDCDQFNKHLFRIQDKEYGNYGMWNHQTNDTLLPVIYEEIHFPDYNEHFCQIALKIELLEEKITEKIFDDFGNENPEEFSYGKNLLYGIIDLNGTIIIEPKYQWIQYAPKSDYFILKLNDKYGVVTKKNEQLLPIEYDKLASVEISSFSGLSFLKKNRLPENLLIFKAAGTKTGVMNLDKKVVVEPIYDTLLPTYNGVLASQGDLTGLLSIDGEIIVSFRKIDVTNVDHGILSGSIYGKRCFIDFYGNVLYR